MGVSCTSSERKLGIPGHGIALIQNDQLELVAAWATHIRYQRSNPVSNASIDIVFRQSQYLAM